MMMVNREMPEYLYIGCPECKDITEHDVLKGRAGKDNITGTFRCGECGRVFSDTIRIPEKLRVKVLFSDGDVTETTETELESNEVLAVGDAEFQKKCIGKMDEVNHKEGRTVLFVSHNMSAVASFCGRGILLKNGSVRETGDISSIIAGYAGSGGESGFSAVFAPGMHGDDTAELAEASIEKESGQKTVDFAITEPIRINIKYIAKKENASLTPGIFLTNSRGERVFGATDAPFDSDGTKKAKPGL
ncbi:MAG: hypothetical protein LBU30_05230, partial [Candidatus Methanoplasma sp.]|nr:hypothetical protein [Candidatus Methanoplasma sp.]